MGQIIWARLCDFQDSVHTITFLTPKLIKIKKNIKLKFGIKEVKCRTDQLIVEEADDLMTRNRNGTGVAFISTSLAKTLGIPLYLNYQLYLDEDCITIGPTIGLLLGKKTKNYTPEFMIEYYSDRMRVYNSIGGMIVAYSTMTVNWDEQNVHGLLYRPEIRTWVPIITTIPKVTYRRHLFQPKFRDFRCNLVKENGMLYNSIRYSKWRIHQILEKNPLIKPYLPETILLEDYNQLMEFINQHQEIILKPKSSSGSKGILVIKRTLINKKENFILNDYRNNKLPKKQYVYSRKTLHVFLDELSIFKSKKYICQRLIDLATAQGSFFDIRILMQKGTDMTWQCSGIECRIADSSKEITNLAAGGTAMPIEKLVDILDCPIDLKKLNASLNSVCNKFCFLMDQQKKQHFAEFGIDLGLDKNGDLWFIEANFRPGVKGFKTFDHDLYLEMDCQPLRYAVAVQGFGVTDAE